MHSRVNLSLEFPSVAPVIANAALNWIVLQSLFEWSVELVVVDNINIVKIRSAEGVPDDN